MANENRFADASYELRAEMGGLVDRHIQAGHAFEEASNNYNEACQNLREQMKKGDRFVVELRRKHFLVESLADGQFTITEVVVL